MGSTYNITVVLPRYHSEESVQRIVDGVFKKYTQIFSTYDSTTEISKFNRSETGLNVSPEFIDVFQLGQRLHVMTQGAWDGTVYPLVELWGFSTQESPNRNAPLPEDIDKALSKVGYPKITLRGTFLEKSDPSVTLTFSSLAPGYIADKLGQIFQGLGSKHIFIEIGGEVLTIGSKADGTPWKVGINTPTPEAKLDDFFTIIPIQNRALATSGDYRNFFESNGVTYGHILNPKTGYPVEHRIVSVSILAPNCALADGLATAVLVLGRPKGLALIDTLKDVDAMIIEEGADKNLVAYFSKGFPQL